MDASNPFVQALCPQHHFIRNEADQLVFRDVDGTQRAMRPFWYPLGLEDPAAMHMILCTYD